MSGESNTGLLLYVIAALVGMAVGFVTVWSQIRNQSRQAKIDVDVTQVELEKRLRDFLNLKLDNLDTRLAHIREDVARLEKRVNNEQDDSRRQ